MATMRQDAAPAAADDGAVAERISRAWCRVRGHWRGGLLAEFGPAAAATLGVVVLLLAFVHVVQAAVSQADLRRAAVAAHADASWRCRAMPPHAQDVGCLARLGRAP